jgi:hypothetical protein
MTSTLIDQKTAAPATDPETRSVAWIFDGKADYLLFSDLEGDKYLPIRGMREIMLALMSIALGEQIKAPSDAKKTALNIYRDFDDCGPLDDCDPRMLFYIDQYALDSNPDQIRKRVIAITGTDHLGAILEGKSYIAALR